MTHRMSVLWASIGVVCLLNAATMNARSEEGGRGADRPVAPVHVKRLLEDVRKAQADPAKKAYAGWLNYLATQIKEKPDRTVWLRR